MRTYHHIMWTVALVLLSAVTSFARVNDPVTCRIELDKTVLEAGSPQRAVVKVTLDTIAPPKTDDRPPVNLIIVLDRSGSMSGQKIEKAKEAARTALHRLGPKDLFSLVVYDNHVETIVPPQTAANTEWIETRIHQINPGGGTALYAGVCQGAAEVRKNLNPYYVNRIILLSDGMANEGPSSPDDLGRLGASLVKEDISVTTVGVGNDYNEDLMTSLAQNSDGNTYFVENSKDLPRIFSAELGDVLSVIAKKVTVEINCQDGVRPIRIIGRDGKIKADSAEVYLNQLYGGQEKYILLEVEVPKGEPDQERLIAKADCRYENAINQQQEKSDARVSARYSESQKDVRENANIEVQKVIIENRVAEAKDDAVQYWSQGKREEALQVMKKTSAELEVIGMDLDLPEPVMRDIQGLELEAQTIQDEGMSKSKRKAMRSSSFQIRNQQKSK